MIRYIVTSDFRFNDSTIETSAQPLSHKRNSKGFDRQNRPAAISLHDETPQNNSSWGDNCAGNMRKRFGADDDQWRGRDVPVSDLLEVV